MGPASAGDSESYCKPVEGERLTDIFFASAAARVLAGVAMVTVIALAARRLDSLSGSGAVAAVVIATACMAAGRTWALLLIAFFITGVGLSATWKKAKSVRTGDVVEKGGARDAWQVLANGGVLAGAAMGSVLWPSPSWQVLGAGAIAASTADTWATEIGMLSSRPPRSLVSFATVAPGTSGGVTWLGTIAAAGGALFIALATFLLKWPLHAVCAAAIGGFAGSILDSLLGATLQATRWCEHCGRATEREVHSCGTVTLATGGIRWLDNDAVNALSSLGGAIIGMLCLL
ncbi:MAG: DUF92 domain-containing protein [Gemmatimonadaceae bacterium]|nr:DUF92 domain-containing protein [Gemmatimonadaceae bacterium]